VAVGEPQLRFISRYLHPDKPDLEDDLDVLYRVVSDEFAIEWDGEEIYSEVDFPTIELALALDGWLNAGSARDDDFVYVPTGGADPVLAFRKTADGWSIQAGPRARGDQVLALSGDALKGSVTQFLDELARASRRIDLDLPALLSRIADYSDRQTRDL
jgi:hypothetical protein